LSNPSYPGVFPIQNYLWILLSRDRTVVKRTPQDPRDGLGPSGGVATSYPKELMTLPILPARRSRRIRPYLLRLERARAAHNHAFARPATCAPLTALEVVR
jgi:hypothetical protein